VKRGVRLILLKRAAVKIHRRMLFAVMGDERALKINPCDLVAVLKQETTPTSGPTSHLECPPTCSVG
jgi:hypothetical protein